MDCDSVYVVLDSIKNTQSNSGGFYSLIEILPLIIALLAVIFGPLIQIHISNKRIKTQEKIAKFHSDTQLAVIKGQIESQLAMTKGQIDSQLAMTNGQINSQLAMSKGQIDTQLAIADKQIKSNVHSMNRQKWIDNLRDQISDFISVLSTIIDVKGRKIFDEEYLLKKHERLFFISTKIRLLINPKESDHKQLIVLIDDAINNLNETIKKDVLEKNRGISTDIIKVSQNILKREWQRVKKLE